MSHTAAKVCVNGEIVPAGAARVSAFDAAFLHGVGLFETLRAYGGAIFARDAHLERMRNSAEALKLHLAIDADLCREALQRTLDANGLKDARLRLTVTPGVTQLPNGATEPGQPTILATATALAAYPREYYEKGMTVLLSRFRQGPADPLAGHKTTSYWPRLAALREAQEKHCGEALWFTPENLLAEGSISNVFIVRDDEIRTPPVGTPVLPGIVRAFVLETATKAGRAVREMPLTVNDLLDADEVFLTNSIMEIMPVCRIERKPIGTEKPGPVTAWVADRYREAVHDVPR